MRFVNKFKSQSNHWKYVSNSFCKDQPVEIGRGGDQGKQVSAPLWLNLVVKHISQTCAEHPLSASMVGKERRVLLIPALRIAPVLGAATS